jgi:hypothetical protein
LQINYLKYWHRLGFIAKASVITKRLKREQDSEEDTFSAVTSNQKTKIRIVKKSAYISQNQLAQVVIEILNELKRKGYKLEFRREAACIYCFEWQQWIMPANFTVDDYYYFEDILNPDAERMLYAISLSQGSKGFLIDACNAYMDNISPEMMQKLKLNKIRSHKEELTKANKMKKPVSLIIEALTF